MAKYELTFLLGEEAESKTIQALVETLSAKIISQNNWGQKTLAYAIKKHPSAFFYNWTIDIDKKQVAELKKKLNFHEKILRYLLLVK